MLATALRDLCGWHVGMELHALGLGMSGTVVQIDDDGLVWVRNVDGKEYAWAKDSNRGLPALNSPANWGHWLAWFEERVPGTRLGRYDMAKNWYAKDDYDEVYGGSPPAALLGLWCTMVDRAQALCAPVVPPSVLAWRRVHDLEAAAALPLSRGVNAGPMKPEKNDEAAG